MTFELAKTVVAGFVTPKAGTRNLVIAVILELNDDITSTLQAISHGSPRNAFLSVSDKLQAEFSRLRESLLGLLPSYMVPGLYLLAVQLPMTTSGKVDRRLLSQLLESLSEDELSQYRLSDRNKVGPTTETGRKLLSLWTQVLGVGLERVGIHNRFFQSGGDSFTAMRLVSIANNPLSKIPLSVADVFHHPTLVTMASIVQQKITPTLRSEHVVSQFSLWKEAQCHEPGDTPAMSINKELDQVVMQCGVSRDDIEDVYPCTPLQEGLMAITAQQPHAYVGRWAYRLTADVDAVRLKESWQKLSSIAPITRTRIVPGRLSGALQVVVRQVITWDSGTDLERYLKDDASKPMAYGRALVRPAIVHAAQNQRYFVLTAHHSVYDGWSLRKMFEIVARLYHFEDVPIIYPYTNYIRYLKEEKDSAATLSL